MALFTRINFCNRDTLHHSITRFMRVIYSSLMVFLTMIGTTFATTPIPFSINMSEAVNITGTPRIAIDVGGTTRYATYTSGTGTNILTFTCAMAAGDVDLDGVSLTSPIDLNGGTIKDLNGNDASLTYTPPNTSSIKVNYPSLGMDFTYDADGRYSLNGTIYNDLPSFLSAAGGTFARASIGTYYDSTGTIQTAASGVPRFDYDPVTHVAKGLLIEQSRTNLALNSSALNSWTIAGGTVTTNAITAPDNQMAAEKIVSIGVSSSIHVAYSSYPTSTAGTYTFSIFLKGGEYNYAGVVMHPGSTASEVGIKVDLSNGSLIGGFSRNSVANTLPQSHTIQSAGNGWYRVTISQNFATVTNATYHVWLSPNSATGITTTWTGDGTSGIYAWGAQLEQGSFPTSYIPTTTASVVRAADDLSLGTNTLLKQNAWSAMAETYGLPPAQAATFLGRGNNIGFGAMTGQFGIYSARSTNGATNLDRTVAPTNYYTGLAKSSIGIDASGRSLSVNNMSPASDAVNITHATAWGNIGNAQNTIYLNGDLQKLKIYDRKLPDTQLQLLTQ